MQHKVFLTKSDVQDVVVGELIGIGYPYIHNVYRISNEGTLNFIYHFTKSKEGELHEKSYCSCCNRPVSVC